MCIRDRDITAQRDGHTGEEAQADPPEVAALAVPQQIEQGKGDPRAPCKIGDVYKRQRLSCSESFSMMEMSWPMRSRSRTSDAPTWSQPITRMFIGERGRVSLAKLVLSNANFLILDEPTNHLDIMSKEILEDALNGYEGTILYVSHDRYFINRTAHRILDLTEGQFVSYVGNYDYYLEKHDTVMAAIEASTPQSADADNTAATKAAESEVKLDWKAQKEEQARLRKKENDLKKCEEKIAELETRISEIDAEMSDPSIGTQVAKLQELTKEQATCQEQLEKLYEQWEELAE